MKKSVSLLLAFLLLPNFAVANLPAEQRPAFAAYVFGHSDQNVNRVFGIELTRALVQTGRYRESPRVEEFAAALNNAAQRQAINENRAVEIASEMGIQRLLFVSMSSVLGSYYIDAKIINTETGATMASGNTDNALASISDIRDAASEIIRAVFGVATTRRQATPAQTPPTQTSAQTTPPPQPTNHQIRMQQQFQQSQQPQQQPPQPQSMSEIYSDVARQAPQRPMPTERERQIAEERQRQTDFDRQRGGGVHTQEDLRRATSYVHQTQPYRAQNFTAGERVATWFFNHLIPGVGSFAIMKDNVGGWTQLGLSVGGVALLFGGIQENREWVSIGGGYGYYKTETELTPLFYIGAVSLVTYPIYNIVRSATYNKPGARRVSNDGNGFNFALFPNQNGNLTAYAIYNLEF